MNRLTCLVLVLGAVVLSPSSAPAGERKRPNLVVIIADDLGWDDCGPFGHKTIRTPHLDRLAAQGLRFTRAYVTASSCSPSRASLLTGRYPHQTDAEQLHWPVPANQITFVERLRAAGYWAAAVGKWHLGPALKKRFDLVKEADERGFQLPAGKGKGGPLLADPARASGCEDWVPVLRDRPRDRPFFLWLAALDPHRDYTPGAVPKPHAPEDVRLPPYVPDTPEVRRDFALYYDEIARLDSYVGQVLAELDRQGVADDTVVVFLSDNGRPFPRDKTTLYEGGLRTPLIVRWPGRVAPGSTCDRLVSSVDIAPTLLQIAGVDVGPSFVGQSFLPLLTDPAAKGRSYVFAEDHWHDLEDLGRAAISARYSYIRNDLPALPNTPPADALRSPTFQAMRRLRDAGKLTPAQARVFEKPRPAEELYDLTADLFQLHNLAGDPKHAAALDEHRQALAAWSRETGDTPPTFRTPDEFDRETGAPLPTRRRPRPSKQELQSQRSP